MATQEIVSRIESLSKELVYVDGDLGVPVEGNKYLVSGSCGVSGWIDKCIMDELVTTTAPAATVRELSSKDKRKVKREIDSLKLSLSKIECITLYTAYRTVRD